MRTIWNGSLRLGQVAIPVGLAPTVRDGDEKFRRIHRPCLTPVTLRNFCEHEQLLVEPEDVVPAWQVAKGEYLVMDAEEVAALEPRESRTVAITGFVSIDEFDPLLVRKRYHLVPSKSTIGQRAYGIFAAAMHELDVAALTRFVAWGSEQLGAVTSRGAVLELATLHFHEDLVQADEIADIVDAAAEGVSDTQVELARELVERHTRRLKVDDLTSLDRPRVRALLERKLAGDEIVRAEEPPADDDVAPVDFEFALRQSLKQAPRRRRAKAAGPR